MTSAPSGPPAPSVWTDPAPVDPSWTAPGATAPEPPVSDPEPAGSEPVQGAPDRSRTPLVWGALVLALALVVLAVHAADGFDRRQDLFTRTAPGETFTSGPYELTFSEATVQYSTDSKIYEVVAIGTARTTADQTMTPGTDSSGFSYAQNLLTREVQPVDSYRYGDSEEIMLRARGLTPGVPPVRLSAEFEFTEPPGDTLRLVIFDQEFSDKSVFGDQDPRWNSSNTGHDLRLPMTKLPDREY